jgi:hypothetical protein
LIAVEGEKPKENQALKQEPARHEAVIKNMHPLGAYQVAPARLTKLITNFSKPVS